MTRPVRITAYRIGRDLGKDVDEVLSWPLSKLHEYMAFYLTESEQFQKDYAEEMMTPEQQMQAIMKMMGGSK